MKIVTLFVVIVVITFSSCKKEDPNSDVPLFDLQGIAFDPTSHPILIPPLFPKMEIPSDNPTTKEGVILGRFLFYDPILSRDSSISCASCHKQELAFTDGLAKSIGIDGRVGKRSAMSLANVGFANRGLFWEGRVSTLEIQALHPVEDPNEMDEKWPNVIRKLQLHSGYHEMFRKAFGIKNNKEITKELVAKALAQFQRTLVSADSKFDKFIRQELLDLTNDEFEGYTMFIDGASGILADAECDHCHKATIGIFALDNFFHNGLLTTEEENQTETRFNFTGFESDKGKFRAVTLRNIAVTAPYMHDGRISDLDGVLDHYGSGGQENPRKDPLISDLKRTNLNEDHKRKVKLFLLTLTDSTFITNPEFSNPFDN